MSPFSVVNEYTDALWNILRFLAAVSLPIAFKLDKAEHSEWVGGGFLGVSMSCVSGLTPLEMLVSTNHCQVQQQGGQA